MGTSRIPQTSSETVRPFRYPALLPVTTQDFPLAMASVTRLTRCIIIELLFASRAMAADRMTVVIGAAPGELAALCRECQRVALAGKTLVHALDCKTGRVMAAIDELSAWTDDLSQFPAERSSREDTSEDCHETATTTPFRGYGFYYEAPTLGELDAKTEAGL